MHVPGRNVRGWRSRRRSSAQWGRHAGSKTPMPCAIRVSEDGKRSQHGESVIRMSCSGPKATRTGPGTPGPKAVVDAKRWQASGSPTFGGRGPRCHSHSGAETKPGQVDHSPRHVQVSTTITHQCVSQHTRGGRHPKDVIARELFSEVTDVQSEAEAKGR